MSKAKKEKAPKEKKPKKEKAPKEGKEGKKKKKLLFIILPVIVIAAAAAIVVFVVLPRLGGGGEDPAVEESVEPQPPELPPEYTIGDATIVGMTLGADESAAKAELAKTVVYTYTDLVDAGKAAETYVGQLAAESPAFSVVDEEFVRTTRPDFTTQEGMVLLARDIVPEETEEEQSDAEEEGEQEPSPAEPAKVLTVRIEWSKGVCVVTADEAEGTVTSPPPPPVSSSGSGGMSIGQAQDYLEGLDPAKLGLAGTTMDEYEVLPIDGVVMVNDTPCTMLNIYSSDAQHNNRFMGSYLMSLDGAHLYQLDPATNEIKILE